MHYIQALPTVLAVLLFTFLGFVVVHNQRREINRSFITFLFADSLWLSLVFAIDFTTVGRSVYLGRFIFAMSIVMVMTIQLFIDTLLRLRRASLYYWYIYGCGLLIAALTSGTDLIIKGIRLSGSQDTPYPIYGLLYPLFLVYLVPTIAGYMIILFRQSRKLRQEEITRSQLSVIGIGITLFTICSLLTNLILPAILSAAWPSEFAPVGSVLLALSFVYAFGKYRLFDVHFFLVRAAMYLWTLFLTTSLLVTPVVIGFNHFFDLRLGAGKLVIFVASSIFLLYVADYLRKFFDAQTAKVFFRGYYDPQDVLDKLGSVLVRTADTRVLRDETAQVLNLVLNPDFLRYVLFKNSSDPEVRLAKWIDECNLERIDNLIDFAVVEKQKDQAIATIKDKRIALAVKLRTTHE